MKQTVITLNLEKGTVSICGSVTSHQIGLPEGCKGFFLCFESKKAARKFYDHNVDMIEIEIKSKKE